ncbi:MAG TPA: hypothetical protein VF132_12880 [Rudaea sp.]
MSSKFLLRSALVGAFVCITSSTALAASSIVVNDPGDAETNDGVCNLREAIIAANNHAAYDGCTVTGSGSPTTIAFNLTGAGVHEIDIGARLPAITVPVVLDGLTQPGADCTTWPPTLLVQITSPSNGAYNGLTLDTGSDTSIVRGLVINGFNNNSGYAFNFNAAINIHASNGNHIECNFLGTDADGTTLHANLRGVDINSASDNVVGSDGTPKAYFARNLISGNQYGGVDTRGTALSGNRISGNYIGTDVTGTVAMGGQGSAIGVSIGSNPGPATGNFIGWDGIGDPERMRNVISGFTGVAFGAITMEVGAHANRIMGNYIGTDASGMNPLPNWAGIELGSNNSVYENIVGWDGVVDAAKARNVISGNSFVGVDINAANGTRDNAIIGNYIGMNAKGTIALPNGSYGISLDYATANTLVARNWIVQGAAIRFFAAGSLSGGSTASFINNAGGTHANLPALDSSDNCVLGAVQVVAQGANVPNPNAFVNNWWGVPTGPNTAGAPSSDGSITTAPFLTEPATIRSDVIFRNGFDAG